MITAVDNLIRNKLTLGGAVRLPEVGVLNVVRRAAVRPTKKSVIPPSRNVELSTAEDPSALSLVAMIAEAAGCSEAQADEVYRRWLTAKRETGPFVIEGVGRIDGERFAMDAELDAILNPHGHEPVAVRRRSHWDVALWVVAALVVCLAVGCYWMVVRDDDAVDNRVETPAVEQVAVEPAVQTPAQADSLAAPVAESPAVEQPKPAVEQPKPAVEQPKPAVDPAVMPVGQSTSGRSYVVLGIFSSERNARRAATAAQAKADDLTLGLYSYSDKLMVSVYESDDAADAQRFINAHGGLFDGLWVYRKK